MKGGVWWWVVCVCGRNGENCSLTIGENCVIGEGTYLSCRGNNTQLTIGNYCMFSRNVKVMTSDGHDIKKNNTIKAASPPQHTILLYS